MDRKIVFFAPKNIFKKYPDVNFFQLLVITTQDPNWIWIRIRPKMLDPDPNSMIRDPQLCCQVSLPSFRVADPYSLNSDPDPAF
jgi:hypothetical protein